MTISSAAWLFDSKTLNATRKMQEALSLLGIRHTLLLHAVLGALEHSIAHPSKKLTHTEELQLCIAMQNLGFFNHANPRGTTYDYVVWPGDHIDIAAVRLGGLIDSFSTRTAQHVIVLSSRRELLETEYPSAVNRAHLFHREVEEDFRSIQIDDATVRTEAHAMFWVACKAEMLPLANLPKLEKWMFVETGKLSRPMPDFSLRLTDWLRTKPKPGKVFVATSQPFELSQEFACQLLLPRKDGWSVDVVGCHCLPHDLPTSVLVGELTQAVRCLANIWREHGTLNPEQQPALSS